MRVACIGESPEDVDKLAIDGIESVILDITKQDDIARLVERLHGDQQRCRMGVMVNNALVSLSAPVELIPMDDWRENFEVNFFGHVAVTTALTLL